MIQLFYLIFEKLKILSFVFMFKVAGGQETVSQPADKQKLMGGITETTWFELVKWSGNRLEETAPLLQSLQTHVWGDQTFIQQWE